MVEQTMFLNDKEIISFVKDIYGLEVTKVQKIDRGSANIYFLNSDKYILKEFQSKYTKEEIDKEIAVINHLKNNKIQVPVYIETLSKEYSCIYKGRTIIIQEFIEGEILNNNEGNYEQTIECAEIYGKIVSALETLPIELPTSEISSWYSKECFEASIKRHEDLLPMLDEADIESRNSLIIDEFIEYLSTENLFR